MMLTADGRQRLVAIPANPRKRMSSVPVRDRPHASVKALWRALPMRYMLELPTTSAMEPDINNVQPHVRLNIEAGLDIVSGQASPKVACSRSKIEFTKYTAQEHRAYQNSRFGLKSISLAKVGVATTTTPASKVEIAVITVTQAITNTL